MDALLVLKDTITASVVKVVGSCQPCIHAAETNFNGVWITLIICLTAVFITGIVAVYIYFQNKQKKQHCEDVEKCKEAIEKLMN